MKRALILFLLLMPFLLHAQPKTKNKNYPSLLWEISGKGMKKPSYLFGTMHVSSKLAFHLADSFYIGIRNADVVALETNPESWQEDMSKYDLGNNEYGNYAMNYTGTETPNDYLRINTLRFYKYDKKIERALYSNPSTINNLLYRSYGNASSDFEEDTYLDMYIYQCGKKWGKKVAGVEQYGESMKLMAEAYKDAAKDKNKKERSYDQEEGYSSNKLQEAYRSGNLDWLDSINKYNSFSSAFDEKFLYRRNEIQANSIDSILRSGQSLFVGVGAAHLPGNRGVIEILRRQGYRLRPVKMGARDSQHKNQVEKLRVPVVFHPQQADDGFFKVDIPGKFYKFGDDASMDQRQYADMANGSYYMVTRIMTNAWMWGHNTDRVRKIVDSLLYENIPGKIIRKTPVVRNGYQGIDLVNKTRRGDIQRYNIFTTPFEVIIFKMSGTGEYVGQGEEAQRFFSSIQLKEYKTQPEAMAATWKKYSPSYGGFSIDMPHEPYVGNDGSWIYDAEDRNTHTQYRVIRTDVHNYHFVEEDTFDLGLMDESFAASEFIDKEISRQHTTANGYPALDCRYKDKNEGVYLVRFIIQGPHYYTLVAHGKQEMPVMKNFLNSFSVRSLVYSPPSLNTDTALYYTVKAPVFPAPEKEKLDLPRGNLYQEDEEDDSNDMEAGMFRSKVVRNDTTGERIFVNFFKSPRYAYLEDSTVLDKESSTSIFGDTSWIVLKKIKTELPNKMRVWETVVTDTGSSRTLWSKVFYKDGIGFSLITESDTLSAPSAFVKSFFDSFNPADTLRGNDMFAKKTKLFFEDFMSSDSLVHKRAVKGLYVIKFDSTDVPGLKKAIASTGWAEKNYLDTKKTLIRKMSSIPASNATNYLKELYQAAGDTLELQYAVLGTLIKQKTSYGYKTLRDIIMTEPPVLNVNTRNWKTSIYDDRPGGNSILNGLDDSLQLTRTTMPDILPLINLDDYKYPIMTLLGQMVDSGLIKPDDYKAYFSKFLLEAKQELKKQVIVEKQKAIYKAEQEKKGKTQSYISYQEETEEDGGNDNLQLYATLLIPYWNDPQVPALLNQMLSSADKRLKYSTLTSLIRAGKPYPDTILNYFAGLDEYRYELYEDLSDMDKLSAFPAKANQQLLLAHSKLLMESRYGKPDSLLFVDKLKAEAKGREGWIYFFKYKSRKDDAGWKLAASGLVPLDSTKFEWKSDDTADSSADEEGDAYRSKYDFTSFSNVRIREDEPLLPQLQKELKRMLYSKRKSAREFYDRSGAMDYDEISISADETDN